MFPTTFSMIYLGRFPDIDPVEGNNTVENASNLIGSYYDADNPAWQHIVTVTADDTDNNRVITGDGFGGGETLTYDLGGGTLTTKLDNANTVNVRVSFLPGSGEPDYVGLGGIIQTALGDRFFVMIDDDAGLGANSLDNYPVKSISVTSVVQAGQNQNAAASDDQDFITCFVQGTRILTPAGAVAVEDLAIGDLVTTVANGDRPLRAIVRTHVSGARIERSARLRPICIAPGALAPGLPERALRLSRQHRILVTSPVVARVAGVPCALVAAARLTVLDGVEVAAACGPVDYLHLVLDTHDVVLAEGVPAETMYRDPRAVGPPGHVAAPAPERRLQAEVVARHRRHAKPLVRPHLGWPSCPVLV